MSLGIDTVFDYRKLHQLADQRHAAYTSAEPFPHTVIDNFLNLTAIDEILKHFPTLKPREGQTPSSVQLETGESPQLNKHWLSNQSAVNIAIRRFYWELNSRPFLHFLETLTGINGLMPDPHLSGGGLHQIKPGGHLLVHSDFNKHPLFKFDRRLNLLIYLNKDWKESYNGELELWSKDHNKCEKSIAPIAGRCVIFSTNRDSFHGHPKTLSCPEGMTRKSIALYYYTIGRPENEDSSPHRTLWLNRDQKLEEN